MVDMTIYYLSLEWDVKAVIEPSHGAQPSAADLEKVIKIIKKWKNRYNFWWKEL